jgi:hypothetical protein
VKIVPSAANLMGTKAELIIGDLMSVEELLYGMMLPSGNDAAQSLAIYFGTILLHESSKKIINPNTFLTEVDEHSIDEKILTLKSEA